MYIIPHTPEYRDAFEEMLAEYFIRDLNGDIPEDIIRQKLLPHIEGYLEKGIIQVDLILEQDVPAGFSIYQIDTPDSDWCKRPGWGFIREFHITPNYRGKGFGRALAAHTEQQLRTRGAESMYLTSDNAVSFWESCGWRKSGEICSNGLEILTKNGSGGIA